MAKFKEEDNKEPMEVEKTTSGSSETDLEELFRSKSATPSEYQDKVGLYNGFAKDLDTIGVDLRAELESHKNADKGGDILDDAFLQKILEKYEERLKKLSEDFAEKVKKSLDKELPQIKMPEVSGGSAAGPLVGGAATGILTGLLVATIPVTTTSFFIFATTSTLAAAAGGLIGFSAGVVTAGVGAAAGVAVAAVINKEGKEKRRLKRINDTIDAFDKSIKPKYLDWAKDLLNK